MLPHEHHAVVSLVQLLQSAHSHLQTLLLSSCIPQVSVSRMLPILGTREPLCRLATGNIEGGDRKPPRLCGSGNKRLPLPASSVPEGSQDDGLYCQLP